MIEANTLAAEATIPLVRRFPALGRLPRGHLGRFPTPVQRMDAVAPDLWFKREDLSGEPLGGNKVRALDFLLGGVRRGDVVATAGAEGSTHALATAVYARQLGARPLLFRWRQEMNASARQVSERIRLETGDARIHRWAALAYARAIAARLRGARWIPAGGSTPVGILGQVNAALEVADQVNESVAPYPNRVVVPLGTGGTAAGIALGFAIANMPIEVVAVRVVPRIVANAARVHRLIDRTARLIERVAQEPVRRPTNDAVLIMHDFYGGAYGRETTEGSEVSRRCAERTGLAIDPTYGAKALAAAVALSEQRGGTTLFWLSFDGRWLRDADAGAAPDIVALA